MQSGGFQTIAIAHKLNFQVVSSLVWVPPLVILTEYHWANELAENEKIQQDVDKINGPFSLQIFAKTIVLLRGHVTKLGGKVDVT